MLVKFNELIKTLKMSKSRKKRKIFVILYSNKYTLENTIRKGSN